MPTAASALGNMPKAESADAARLSKDRHQDRVVQGRARWCRSAADVARRAALNELSKPWLGSAVTADAEQFVDVAGQLEVEALCEVALKQLDGFELKFHDFAALSAD